MFPDWPLMNGSLFPTAHRRATSSRTSCTATWRRVARARRGSRRSRPGARSARIRPSSGSPLAAYPTDPGDRRGAPGLHPLADWTQTLHVALGALLWGLPVALAAAGYYEARQPAATAAGGAADDGADATASAPDSARPDTVRAYVALTKPRIIELLLVTTVPAMVLATREVPGHDWPTGAGWRSGR